MERVVVIFLHSFFLFFLYLPCTCKTTPSYVEDVAGMMETDKSDSLEIGYEILQQDISFKSQVNKPNTIYEIRNTIDLREATDIFVLKTKINFLGRILYTHTAPIRLLANQAIWVPHNCFVLNATKNEMLSNDGFYMSKETTIVFVASTREQNVSFMISGIVRIPEDCILKFNGGRLENGVVVGQNTIIDAGLMCLFNDNISLAGSWRAIEAYPQWFGAKGDGNNDDTCAIQKTISWFSKIVFIPGTYYFSSQIEIGRNKSISGVEETQNNGRIVLKTNSNITCIRIVGSSVTIENLTIEHPETNTAPIIDFTGYRYINLRNIFCYHYGKPCPAIGLYSGDSNWTGYDVFENCNFSHYSENVRIENGSFVSFYNCKFNRASSRHLFLGGSVFSFINCDITKDPGDNILGVEYTGQYVVDFIGCYLEGFRLTEFAKCTNDNIGAGVRISGSKFYLPTASGPTPSATVYAEFDGVNYYSPDMLPRYSNGFHRSVNKIINGSFRSGLIKWERTANITHADISKMDDLPKGQTFGMSFFRSGLNPGEIWQKVGMLSHGTHTLGMWIQAKDIGPDFRVDIMVSDGRSGNAFKSLAFVTKKAKYEKWQYINCVFNVPLDKLSVDWYVRVYFRGCSTINLSGITLYDGVYAEAGAGNSLSDDIVLTNELIIKGEDKRYYTISVDINGNLKATVVTTE